jgi:hypothetical protein
MQRSLTKLRAVDFFCAPTSNRSCDGSKEPRLTPMCPTFPWSTPQRDSLWRVGVSARGHDPSGRTRKWDQINPAHLVPHLAVLESTWAISRRMPRTPEAPHVAVKHPAGQALPGSAPQPEGWTTTSRRAAHRTSFRRVTHGLRPEGLPPHLQRSMSP